MTASPTTTAITIVPLAAAPPAVAHAAAAAVLAEWPRDFAAFTPFRSVAQYAAHLLRRRQQGGGTNGAGDERLPDALVALLVGDDSCDVDACGADALMGVATLDSDDIGAAPDLAGPGAAWVGNLLVLPPHRGRGVGSALLTRALALLRDRGYARAHLCCTTDALAAWYARAHGFAPCRVVCGHGHLDRVVVMARGL